MGGFTLIQLKDTSRNNVSAHNARLELAGVPKAYRFYSEDHIILEYEAFKINDGHFPEHQFPRDKINSLEDFKQFWSPEALGKVFVPPIGALTFDCYFGRTPKKVLRKLGSYVADNVHEFSKVSGSFSTFAERGMTKLDQEIVKENSHFLDGETLNETVYSK